VAVVPDLAVFFLAVIFIVSTLIAGRAYRIYLL